VIQTGLDAVSHEYKRRVSILIMRAAMRCATLFEKPVWFNNDKQAGGALGMESIKDATVNLIPGEAARQLVGRHGPRP